MLPVRLLFLFLFSTSQPVTAHIITRMSRKPMTSRAPDLKLPSFLYHFYVAPSKTIILLSSDNFVPNPICIYICRYSHYALEMLKKRFFIITALLPSPTTNV
uniref:Putative secreted protein n=1 Tax=Anopheles triannulatus TaxID=58253 RepID=A0A2M4B2T6_9DIPT